MTRSDIQKIIDSRSFPFQTDRVHLIETHISYVIMTDHYVYKIKKPVKFSFLDFSSVKTRKEFCEKEVSLNRRLAKHMYLDVLPVRSDKGHLNIDGPRGEIVDWVILMKRMDESRQMDFLLEKGEVNTRHITALAKMIANFHQNAKVIKEGEDWKALDSEFADIATVKNFLRKNVDSEGAAHIDETIAWVHSFLKSLADRIHERNQAGYIVDGHGDLHCRNIFLMEEPVIFDCIEFNDEFRKLDLLSEIAFLFVDLERFGRTDLAELLCKEYFAKMPCIENEVDLQIFDYYKMYRANVMVKVLCVRATELDENSQKFQEILVLIRKYLDLYNRYYTALTIGAEK